MSAAEKDTHSNFLEALQVFCKSAVSATDAASSASGRENETEELLPTLEEIYAPKMTNTKKRRLRYAYKDAMLRADGVPPRDINPHVRRLGQTRRRIFVTEELKKKRVEKNMLVETLRSYLRKQVEERHGIVIPRAPPH